MFLPNFSPADLPGFEPVCIDPAVLSPPAWAEALESRQPEVLVIGWGTPPIPVSYAASPGLTLRYVCHLGGGVHSLVPRMLLERGVLVSNWGTAISYTVAEHAVLLTLAALRNLPLWPSYLEMPPDRVARIGTRGLRGKRVGIHGFGGIAREVVDMLQGFKVEIFAYSAGVPSELFQAHGVRECNSLQELFSTIDVLIECEGLNASTRGSVSEAVLDQLHDGAVFVNVGRGAVVDEAHLQRIASSGRVRVALDVFAMEPLKPSSPWLDIPAACISPHIGGPTADAGHICGEHGLRNVRRYLRGDAIEGAITLDLYDRSA